MMKDVIRVTDNFKRIKSPNLQKFITDYVEEKDIIQSNNNITYISLQSLRRVYVMDNMLFFRLVKEFALRGFKVMANGNETIFYKDIALFDDETSEVLKKVSPNEKLDMSQLIFPNAIQNFLKESDVQNSDFFSGIIVENIEKVFPDTEDTLFILLNKIGIRKVKKINENDFQDAYDNNQFVPIKYLFNPGSDNLIIKAFETCGVHSINELNQDALNKILNFKGIGEKKRKRIINTIGSLNNIGYLNQLKQQSIEKLGDNNILSSQSNNNSNSYINVFPEILVNSVDARNIFSLAKINTIPIQLPLSKETTKNALGIISGDKRPARLQKVVQRIYDDVHNYLDWVNSNDEKSILTEAESLKVVKALKLSKELIKWGAANNSKELNRELEFEFYQGLNLDKTMTDVQEQITRETSNKTNTQKIIQIRKNNPEATLQSIGEMIGVTRERVRQIEVKISEIKKTAVEGYRLNEAFWLDKVKKGQRFIFLKDVSKNLVSLLELDTNSSIGKLPILIVGHDDKLVSNFKRLNKYLENNNEVKIKIILPYFSKQYTNANNIISNREEIISNICECYGFKFRVEGELFKKLDRSSVALKIILNEYGRRFNIHDVDVGLVEQQFLKITGSPLFQESIKEDKKSY